MAADRVRLGLILEASPAARSDIVTEFQEEVDRILDLPEVEPVWRNFADAAGHEVFDRIVLLRLTGSCAVEDFDGQDREGPLGITHVSDGRILPFVEVRCERIIAVLARNRAMMTPYHASGMIGRALARVAAHEIYHVLADRQGHHRSGLAKSSFSYNDLFGHVAKFADESIALMRANLLEGDKLKGLTAAAKTE